MLVLSGLKNEVQNFLVEEIYTAYPEMSRQLRLEKRMCNHSSAPLLSIIYSIFSIPLAIKNPLALSVYLYSPTFAQKPFE